MRRRLLMLSIAAVLALVDLAEKAAQGTEYHHARSSSFLVITTIVVFGLVLFVPRVPSRVALLGAAVAAGGALGNLVSAIVWSQGVPDPLVVGAMNGIAFNLADLFVLIGDAVMLSAITVFALRHRSELRATV